MDLVGELKSWCRYEAQSKKQTVTFLTPKGTEVAKIDQVFRKDTSER